MSFLDLFDRSDFCRCLTCEESKRESEFAITSKRVGICKKCNEHLPFVEVGKIFEEKGKISYGFSAFYYLPPISKMIIDYKFSSCSANGLVLAEYLKSAISVLFTENNSFDLVCPVPISKEHQKERGFNQAEILAKVISDEYGIPLSTSALIKTRNTKRQSDLSPTERITNLVGAYKADKLQVEGKNILLVDDVYTTGSTARNCSNALFYENAKSVVIATIARKRISRHSKEYNELLQQ